MDFNAQGGYSLVELITVLTIAAVLTTLGVPSYRYVTNSSRVTAEVNSLFGDLELARSAAIKQGSPVTVCPSQDARTCWHGSQAWQKGWIVFSDINGNGVVDADDTIMLVQRAFFSGTDTFLADAGASAVIFNREGYASNLPSTPSGYITVTLHTQPLNANWTRCVQISTLGLLTTEHARQGACL